MSESPKDRTESPPPKESPRVFSGERRGVFYAFCWLFCVLLGYFVLRPVRETMGTVVGTRELRWLFITSFFVMLVAVPFYAALVVRLPRRWIVRVVFHFFAGCLLAFWMLMRVEDANVQVWTARVLFVWISVFGVFSTSVFWSVLADLYSSAQGRRLFGIIAAGGTSGAVVGSLLTSQLATDLSTRTLLLLPAAVIELGLWFAWRLEKQSGAIHQYDDQTKESEPTEPQRIDGGGLLTGITHVLMSPYLSSICVFLVFVQGFGTLLYFEQAEIVNDLIPQREQRTEFFAQLDLGTQLLTLLIQVLLSGLILRRLGVSFALIMLPCVYFAGFASLAFDRSLMTLAVIMVASRGVAYGITVPSREVLFTVVSREDKYKSKNFIDTVVLRGGDSAAGLIVGSLRDASVSLVKMNLWALPLVAIWAGLAWRLGRRQRRLAIQELPVPVPGQSERQGDNTSERDG